MRQIGQKAEAENQRKIYVSGGMQHFQRRSYLPFPGSIIAAIHSAGIFECA
jgi:hypothetical protein